MTEETKQNSKKKLIAYLIIALAAIGMLFMGIPVVSSNGNSDNIATVNGQGITAKALNLQQYYLAKNGQDPNTALGSLTQQTLIAQYAKKNDFLISDQALANSIRSEFPNAQDYQNFLKVTGVTPKFFEDFRENDLLSQNYTDTIISNQIHSDFSSQVLMEQLSMLRDIHLIQLSKQAIKSQVSVTDEALQKYYQAHLNQYFSPVSVDISYILLDPQAYLDHEGKADPIQYGKIANEAFDLALSNTSLAPIAQLTGRPIMHLKNVLETSNQPTWIADKNLQDNLFSKQNISLNTLAAPLTVDGNKNLFYIITHKAAPAQLPFSAVQEQVRNDYINEQAEQMLITQANTIISAVNHQQSINQAIENTVAQVKSYQNISLMNSNPSLSREIQAAVFSQTQKASQINEPNGDIAISVLDKIYPSDPSAITNNQMQILALQLKNYHQVMFVQSFTQWLKNQAKIK